MKMTKHCGSAEGADRGMALEARPGTLPFRTRLLLTSPEILPSSMTPIGARAGQMTVAHQDPTQATRWGLVSL